MVTTRSSSSEKDSIIPATPLKPNLNKLKRKLLDEFIFENERKKNIHDDETARNTATTSMTTPPPSTSNRTTPPAPLPIEKKKEIPE